MNFDHRLISRFQWNLSRRDTFDWNIADRISFFDPIGLTFLAGLIDRQMSLSQSGTITFRPDIINYLERIDFLSYLDNEYQDRIRIIPERPSIHRRPLRDRVLEFSKKSFEDTSDIEHCIRHLSQLCAERSGDAIQFMYIDDVFGELLSNVEIHSNASSFYVVAQRYSQKHVLKISVADLGVGIPVKIRSIYKNISSDHDAIIHATESEVTTSSSMGGLGLTTLKSYLEDPQDYLFIASNNGCVKFTHNRQYVVYNNFSSPLEGTFVEICFKANSSFRRF